MRTFDMPFSANAAPPVATAPPVDDRTDHAISRIADIHACFGYGDEPLTRDQIRTVISNAAHLILRSAGLPRDQIAAAMRDRYGFG